MRKSFDAELDVGMVCRDICFENGLIMRAVGDRMIIAPPLVITRRRSTNWSGLIGSCLDQTAAELRRRGAV